jgi:hypothetical protein
MSQAFSVPFAEGDFLAEPTIPESIIFDETECGSKKWDGTRVIGTAIEVRLPARKYRSEFWRMIILLIRVLLMRVAAKSRLRSDTM